MFSGVDKSNIAAMALTNMNPSFRLDFWQQWYLESNEKFLGINKSRRIGWSYITSGKSVVEAIDPDITKYQNVFVSYGMNDAIGKIADARNFLMNIPERYHKQISSDSKTQLEFWDVGKKSKSSLISLPNRTLRGFGTSNPVGGISLDEFAFHKDDYKVYESALPCLSRGGLLSIGSTPLSKTGMFYEIMSDEKRFQKYKRVTIPWWWSSALCTNVERALQEAPGMSTHERVYEFGTDIMQEIFESLSLSSFKQEYECTFTDEAEAFISREMIMDCTPQTDPETGEMEQYEYQNLSEFIAGKAIDHVCTGMGPDGEFVFESLNAPGYDVETHGLLYAGYDIGRKNDLSVFTLIGYLNGKKHVWMVHELKNKSFDEQKHFIEQAMELLPIRCLNIDATGIGMDMGEWAEKKFKTRAFGCTFTNSFKEDMANKGYLSFERKEFVLPMNRRLHEDIYCIRKTVTTSKNNRYDGSTNDSHADRFWSMMLANIGIDDKKVNGVGKFYKEYHQRKNSGSAGKSRRGSSTGNRQLDSIIRRGNRYGSRK